MMHIHALLPFGTSQQKQNKLEIALAIALTDGKPELIHQIAQLTFAVQGKDLETPLILQVSSTIELERLREQRDVFRGIARVAEFSDVIIRFFEMNERTIFGSRR